ncbi:MAG: lipopolysaccharide biosynthesis protein [Planctomycetota bacterium]|jgi:O-antigen/teichoic acid export membrane protein
MSLKFLGKATFLYAVGNICLRAASFLLIPIYTHYLAGDDFAVLMILLLSTQFMIAGMNCGTEHSIVRFAKHYEKNGLLNDLMGTAFLVSILSSLIVACIVLTLLLPFFQHVLHRQNATVLIILTLLCALFQSLCDMLTAYYRSQNQPIKFTIVGIATALILTVLSFVFLFFLKMGVHGALIAKFITHGLIFGIIALQIYSKTGFGISFKLFGKLLHFGLPLAMSSCGQHVITGAGVFVLSVLAGLNSVAIFSLGYKLASVLLMVLVFPFQLAFQPYVFSQLDTPDIKKQMSRSLTYMVWAVVAGSFCILFGLRLLFPLIAPPEFSNAYIVTLMILPAMAFLGLFYYGETLLKTTQRSYAIGLFVAISAIFSIIANYFLIDYFSWYGAILASNTTLLLLGGSLFIIGLREYPISIEWRRLRTAVILFVGVLALNLLLLKTNLYLFCVTELTVAAVVLFTAFRSSLLDEREKQFAKHLMCRLEALVKWAPRKEAEEIS